MDVRLKILSVIEEAPCSMPRAWPEPMLGEDNATKNHPTRLPSHGQLLSDWYVLQRPEDFRVGLHGGEGGTFVE